MYVWFLCIIAADFITGLIHWFEDTYITPDWPILGKHVGEPNITHHEHPGWIGRMSNLISRNYQTVIPAVLVVLLVIYFQGWQGPIIFTLLLASLGNEIHTWNHRSGNPLWIRMLQEMAIIQTPQQHSKHHKKPYTACYCTITNFLNPILDHSRFWKGLEWIILKTTGTRVKRGTTARRGY